MKRMRDRKKLPTSVTLLTHKRKSNRNRIRTNEQTPKKESRADHRYIEQYRFGVKSEIPKYRCEIRKAQIKGRDRTECRARAHTHTHSRSSYRHVANKRTPNSNYTKHLIGKTLVPSALDVCIVCGVKSGYLKILLAFIALLCVHCTVCRARHRHRL